jgi:A/G-specific adenine glycosylase
MERMNEVLPKPKIEAIRSRLVGWGEANYKNYPWRENSNPYLALVAELLLTRTRAENVLPVYNRFTNEFPTPASLAEADLEHIGRLVHPLGLRWRVPLLKALGKRLAELGHVPTEPKELLELPGIGPYSAAAWLSFHAGRRGVLVDSNVVRWICRLLCREYNAETRRKKWLIQLADKLTPHERTDTYNYAVLDFTMQVCVPGRPKCEICPIGADLCCFGLRNT